MASRIWETILTIKWFVSCMVPGFIGGGILFFLLLWFRRRRMTDRKVSSGLFREIGLLLFAVYTGGMAAITLVPEVGWLHTGLTRGRWYPYWDFDPNQLPNRINLLPFSMPDSPFMIVGNVAMFVPFGFFAALLWRRYNWKRALGTGLGITLFIECWQVCVGRIFDIDDIILNTLGVFCGYLLWLLLKRFAPGFVRRFQVVDR